MVFQQLYDQFERYRTLRTGRIRRLPVVILMPHSACNCRCVMCDIWKDNKNLKQLTEKDVRGLLDALQAYGTRQVVMSGGEALLNRNFFTLCSLLQEIGLRISLLSTGLTLKQHAGRLASAVDDIIVSLDGDEETHDRIRNIPGAFARLSEGIQALRAVSPGFRITGRSVIHRLNYRKWPAIIAAARQLGLDQISFLPADVSSQAFNRPQGWEEAKQNEILISGDEIAGLKKITRELVRDHRAEFDSGFIADSPEKIWKIYGYHAAQLGMNPFPFKKCNAPWVSAVIEADGTVRPCFFHAAIGNIHDGTLDQILNGEKGLAFRRQLDIASNPTCIRCVCYLHLRAGGDSSPISLTRNQETG
jgi:radical SAM protein with 4Fe4S-binding SPASM domain